MTQIAIFGANQPSLLRRSADDGLALLGTTIACPFRMSMRLDNTVGDRRARDINEYTDEELAAFVASFPVKQDDEDGET